MNRSEAIKKWDEIIKDIETKRSAIDIILAEVEKVRGEISSKKVDILSADTSISDAKKSIEEIGEQIKIKTEGINQFFVSAEQNKTFIEDLKSQTESLLKLNNEQSDKVSDLLQKVAAGRLFESFNVRKKENQKTSVFWMWMIIISIVLLTCMAGLMIWALAHMTGGLSYEFLLKISIAFPLLYWLIFSTRQYSKSKRLEEEYAFRSAISLSLEAYRDLVKKEAGEPTKADVIPFVTEAVSKIFASPSVTISEHPHKDDQDIAEGIIDKLLQLVNKIKG